MGNGIVLGLVGSPNPKGKTNELVTAALEGAARSGARTELVQMSEHIVAACKDCLPWVCRKNLKCTYEDPAFEFLSEKVLNCDALVLGSPVYWADTSAMVKYFTIKMLRTHGMAGSLRGLPALGVAIAGGTGNGLVAGLRPLYHFFYVMAMRALEPLPATRFNFDSALQRANELGAKLASMCGERQPLASIGEWTLWYDELPYIGMDRAAERRLLAGLTTAALTDGSGPSLASRLVAADVLASQGRKLEALDEVIDVYRTGLKLYDGR